MFDFHRFRENSKNHKVSWLKDNNFDPTGIIITGRKESYAVDKATGNPNILIDDKPSNLDRWKAKGGIGIRYQANEDDLEYLFPKLQEAIENVIRGNFKYKN